MLEKETNQFVAVEGTTNTTHLPSNGRRFPPILLSYLLFFFSGAAALIYEISWSRQIGLLLGQTANSAAVVLSSYFAGLALGYYVGGRWASRLSPLWAYGVAELFAAAWACLIPQFLSWMTTPEIVGWFEQVSYQLRFASNAIFCFLLLLPATVALGTTLPLMAEFLSPKSRLSTGRVSLAYGLNTLGAVLGVVSSFGLLVMVGVKASSYVAAGISAACGLGAFALASLLPINRSAMQRPASPSLSVNSTTTSFPFRWWEIVAGVSGFGTLALEVLYTRMFSLVFHNSTYTFGAIVAVFLVALALGAFVISLLHRRVRPEKILATSSLLAAIGILLSIVSFLQKTQLEYFHVGDSFAEYLLGSFGLVSLLVLPAGVMAGMILPIAWKVVEDSGAVGSRVLGRMTMINTLAASAGAVSANFLLLPILGLWLSFAAVAGLFGLIALAALLRNHQRSWAVALFVGFLVTLGLVLPQLPHSERLTGEEGGEVVRRWESAYGWIDVVRDRNGNLQIRQNVHYRMGATGRNADREYRQAHLPLLLHPSPEEVLFLGLGTGLTAGAATQHDAVERVHVIELIPEVIEAARLFSEENRNVVDHPKVTMQVDDARHWLLATDRQFDVIVSDLFVPWESRTGYLYTVQHYRIARERLKPGGLFCQWLPLYQIGPEEFERIANSFASVFPQTTLWWGQLQSHRAIVALVGRNQPLPLEPAKIDTRIQTLQRTGQLSDHYFSTSAHLFDLYLGQWTIQNPSRLNTDEQPWVEFLAPLSHQDGTLLQGPELRSYYDHVLSRLPVGAVELPRDTTGLKKAKNRRAWQRFLLFGEPSEG